MAERPSGLLQHRPTATRRGVIASVGAAIGSISLAGCLNVSGRETIVCTGSNTVAPITDWAAEMYIEERNPDVIIAVDPQGTGAGFSEFGRGRSDVQSASRDITEEEHGRAVEHGVDYSRYDVGLDGLVVAKHEDNDWLEEFTLEELERIWQFESDVTHWSDVREEYPDEPMLLYGRDSAAGTFDYFTLAVTGEVGNVRDDYSAHSQTNQIMSAVGDDEHALGWGSLGYFESALEEGQPVEAVPIESDVEPGEFFLPTQENIEGGLYSPLARPLYIFVSHQSLAERPHPVGSFVQYYLSNQQWLARDERFFGLPDEEVVATLESFAADIAELGVAEAVREPPELCDEPDTCERVPSADVGQGGDGR